MFFYRIENKDGVGVYEADIGNIAANYSDEYPNTQANPKRTFEHFNENNPEMNEWYFGFPTLDDLYSWFNTFESISYMKFKQCRIIQYQIEDDNVIVSGNQLTFKKENATATEFIDFDYKKTKFRDRSIYSDYYFIDSNFKAFMRKEEMEYHNLRLYGTKHEPRMNNDFCDAYGF